jgi:hypothetical protein
MKKSGLQENDCAACGQATSTTSLGSPRLPRRRASARQSRGRARSCSCRTSPVCFVCMIPQEIHRGGVILTSPRVARLPLRLLPRLLHERLRRPRRSEGRPAQCHALPALCTHLLADRDQLRSGKRPNQTRALSGYPLPHAVDFSVPGVTTISCDPHKYAYGPKVRTAPPSRSQQRCGAVVRCSAEPAVAPPLRRGSACACSATSRSARRTTLDVNVILTPTALYISFVILHIKHTGQCDDDVTACAHRRSSSRA